MPRPTVPRDDRLTTHRIAQSIEGWLTSAEGQLLYDLAKKTSVRGDIVEIGSWKGKSTVFLARGSKAGRGDRVYSVDHHRGSSEHAGRPGGVNTEADFRMNMERASVMEIVIPLVMSSRAAARVWRNSGAPIRLLWIDASHEYSSVIEDIDLWIPFLVNGGLIALHDFTYSPGVRRAVIQRVLCSRSFDQLLLCGSILLARKTSNPSLFRVYRNMLAYAHHTWVKPLVWRLISRTNQLRRLAQRFAELVAYFGPGERF